MYSVFGHGIVSAHALDGTRKWIRYLETPSIKYASASSPVLAGGLLIVQLNDLIALDPKTGDKVWQTKLDAKHATPFVSQIEGTDILVHPSGAIVRASDGKILAKDLFNAKHASPLVHDGVIYAHLEDKFLACQLPRDSSSPPKLLWEAEATHGGYTIASPVLHQGLFWRQQEWNSRGG